MTNTNQLRVPDIYIIGAQKSGTTTLYDWLSQHPQIYGHPLAKDFPFFSNDQAFQGGIDHFHSFVKDTPNNHLALGGDANAMFSLTAINRMKNTIPSARLIAILRNPVDRAYSAYTHAIERMMETRSFEEAINDEIQGYYYDPIDSLRRDYLIHGLYAKQLSNLLGFFPNNQIKIVIFEELMSNTKETLSDIFEFIGVHKYFVPDMTIHNETKGGYRIKWLAQLAYGHPSTQKLRNFIKAFTPFYFRTSIRKKLIALNRIKTVKPPFPSKVRILLEKYYSSEIKTLESLLNKEITLWYSN